MAFEWKSHGAETWLTSGGLGWVEDYSDPDSPYFAMWWRRSALHGWQELRTDSGRRTHRRSLHAAKIEVERKLKTLDQREAA